MRFRRWNSETLQDVLELCSLVGGAVRLFTLKRGELLLSLAGGGWVFERLT